MILNDVYGQDKRTLNELFEALSVSGVLVDLVWGPVDKEIIQEEETSEEKEE